MTSLLTRVLLPLTLVVTAAIFTDVTVAQSQVPAIRDQVVDAVKRNKGRFTGDVRETYLQYCEAECIAQLAAIEVKLTQPQLNFVRRDKELRDACFASVYPADARIMMNILELRHQLGAEMFNKYKGLCIANAVVRRHVGVGPLNKFVEKEEHWARGPVNPDEYQWFPYTFIDIKDTYLSEPGNENVSDSRVEARAAAEIKAKDAFDKDKTYKKYVQSLTMFPTKAGYDKLTAFLKKNSLLPTDLFQNPEHAKAAMAYMGVDGPKSGLFSRPLLDEYMAYSGLRPDRRDPGPSATEFIEYIDRLERKWDANPDLYPIKRFPVQTAPWPLLFPLAKGWPLREAEDILKLHEGATKLKTYGNYQNKAKVLALRYEPFEWNYDSWHGKVQAGGVCHQMSTIGVGAYQAFGTPACKAGSGHHSFLIIFYQRDDGGFAARTRQGAGGWSQWGFVDPHREYSTDFHKAFALSCSLGLDSYMWTRAAVNLAKLLKDVGDTESAVNVLKDGIAINRFNPELWFYLALYTNLTEPSGKKLTPAKHADQLEKAKFLDYFARTVQSSSTNVIEETEYTEDTDLSQVENEVEVVTSREEDLSAMVRRMSAMVGQVESVDDQEVNRQMLALLKSHEASALPNIVESLQALEVAVDGWQSASKKLLKESREKFNPDIKVKVSGDLVTKFNTVVSVVSKADRTGAEYLEWLKEMTGIVEQQPLYQRFRKKVYLDALYGAVMPELLATLQATGNDSDFEKYSQRFEEAKNRMVTRKKKE